jgi:cytoskeleton protein RodZ
LAYYFFKMASLGQDLKRERELRGISLQEIADSTRISLRYLQAIEEDRLDIIPGQFFVRAILRSYARSVGLDENQVLNKYQEKMMFEEQLEYQEAKKRTTPPRLQRSKKALVLALGLVVLVGAAALLYLLVFSSPDANRVPLKPPVRTEPEAAASVPSVSSPQRSQEPAIEERKSLDLNFSFLEDTWIQVSADGRMIWDGTKKSGESLQVKAEREVILSTGNAGGMSFTINGEDTKPLGPRGAVRKDIAITLDNYRQYLPAENNSEP